MPHSPLADTVTDRPAVVYAAAAEPGRAGAMRAYMRDVAPFPGLTTPVRRGLSRRVLGGLPRPGEADRTALPAVARARAALRPVDLLRRHVTYGSSGFLPVVRHLVTTAPRWDTVDLLAAHAVGRLVAADRGLTAGTDARIADDGLWLVRTALLRQPRYRERTDTDRLFGYRLRRSGHPDFFVRKAIGWCLREYAKTAPVPYAPSWPRTGRPSPRCPRGRRCGTPVRSAGAGAASIELPCQKKAFDMGQKRRR
ncbi:DNA alkylation repair protein [Streptomyces flaveolus]|uniref:DNA alkylation repair protein n=1 Tax=Streptomyces flaveolus TaxID=67297 RepID=UPI003702B01A